MILYACDTCHSAIDVRQFREGDALLMGDRAYCARCNPRAAAASAGTGPASAGHGAGAGHAAGAGFGAGGGHGAGAKSFAAAAKRDGVYVAGVIGLVVLLPLMAAFVTYRLTSGANEGGARHADGADAPDQRSGGGIQTREGAAEAAMRGELEGVRQENARLLERMESLAAEMAAARRATPPRDAGEDRLTTRLEGLDRMIERLETRLLDKLSSDTASLTRAPVEEPKTPIAAPQQPQVLPPAAAAPGAGGRFGQLLNALATGAVPPELDVTALLDDEDPSIRMLACKLAGLDGVQSGTLDRARLLKLKARMHDRDPEVQRAAMVASGAITGEKNIAWDDLSADQYAMIARMREVWAQMGEGAGAAGAAPAGGADER